MGMENTTSDVNCAAYYNTEEWSYSGFQHIVVSNAYEHADRLAKQGTTMEQEKLPITLKQNKNNNAKKIPDDYHTLHCAGQVTLIRRRTGHNRLNSHMHRKMNLVPSPLCTCGTEDQTTEHILQRCPVYQHLRRHIWSDGTSLHHKLYGKKEELERIVGFIQ